MLLLAFCCFLYLTVMHKKLLSVVLLVDCVVERAGRCDLLVVCSTQVLLWNLVV